MGGRTPLAGGTVAQDADDGESVDETSLADEAASARQGPEVSSDVEGDAAAADVSVGAGSSRWHRAEDRLFAAIQRARAEAAARGQASSSLLEYELLPAMRAAAAVHVRSGSTQLPPGADRDDVISYIDERIVRMLRSMDFSLDAPQIVSWIYRSIKHAIVDAQRAQDTLSRRERERANEAERLIKATEKELGRALNDLERREVAKRVLGVRQAQRRDADQLVNILVNEIHHHGLEHAEAIASATDTETDAEERYQAQVLHIAGADVDDDEVYAAFADMITGGRITSAGLDAGVKVAIAERLGELGMAAPEGSRKIGGLVPSASWQPSLLPAGSLNTAPDADAPPRPHRHYVFEVPEWGPLHDRVIDAVAVDPLGMRIGIDRRSDVAEVFVAEPPELLWGARRWRLFTIVLAAPDMAGRREWTPTTRRIRERLPNGLSMRLITKEMFDTQIERLRRVAAESGVEPPLAGFPEPQRPVAGRPASNASVPTEPSAPGLPRDRLLTAAIPLPAGREVLAEVASRIATPEAPLTLCRDPKHPRYVVSDGPDAPPLFAIPTELTALFDAELADDAVWTVMRWTARSETGSVTVSLRRTSPRHGQPSTYRNYGCHCARCTAAHTSYQLTWRAKTEKYGPKPKPPIKHGGGCRKRGCPCEVGKQAERDRQKRSRERRRREQQEGQAATKRGALEARGRPERAST